MQETFEPAWIESENEERARRQLTAERCRRMESALLDIGFDRGSLAWRLAVLVAKVGIGWTPVTRTLEQLAIDPDIEPAFKTCELEHRKRNLRRVMADLEDEGLLCYESQKPRGRGRSKTYVLQALPSLPTSDIKSDINPDIKSDKPRTNVGHQPGHQVGQTSDIAAQNIILARAPFPKNPSYPPPPLAEAAAEVLEISEEDPEVRAACQAADVRHPRSLVREANAAGVTRERLLDWCRIVELEPRLDGGGAIRAMIRDGDWPVDDVPELPELLAQQERKRRAVQASTSEQEADRLRFKIRRLGLERCWTQEQIEQQWKQSGVHPQQQVNPEQTACRAPP